MLDEDLGNTSPEELEAEIEALHVGIIDLFPPIWREIILLHFAEGLTYREIAERMDVSETTIYKHLHSALNQLRQTLKNGEKSFFGFSVAKLLLCYLMSKDKKWFLKHLILMESSIFVHQNIIKALLWKSCF